MADRSLIEWTDRTWNPVTGCSKVSPGCEHCYVEAIAHRFAGSATFPDGFALTLHPGRLDAPLRWRAPSRVFVNSMSDLFHDQVPDEFLARVFTVMARAHRHTFQVLTKRHGRMRSLLRDRAFGLAVLGGVREADPARRSPGWPLPNVWLGVSVEDQKRAGLRIPALLDTPAAVRFLSCEPLLGPVDLTAWLGTLHHCPGVVMPPGSVPARAHTVDCCTNPGLDWVIAGGESGPGARPMHPDWARSLRDQCQHAGVPFFFKQWGHYAPHDTPPAPREPITLVDPHGIADTPHRGALAPPGSARMARYGKKRAGRVLDGRTWDDFPEVTP